MTFDAEEISGSAWCGAFGVVKFVCFWVSIFNLATLPPAPLLHHPFG
ncbi:hypothetical protein KCP73_00920 [Salmonella enterica subsp. enterica]|nr:hypothetical protein KCP73_00920 [Salmonella enterica subsp. enterica]